MINQFKLADFDLDINPLGSGYIAQIYKAFHRPTQQFYALKIIDIKKAGTTEKIALKREEKLHSTLEHKNIVRFYGSFKTSEKLYFVLELIKGQELFKYIQTRKTFIDEQETLYIIRQLLQAISYIHKRGIIHRDIKPENIMINDQKKIKLVDFGFTAEYGLDMRGKTINRTTKCGTTDYFAPEILNSVNQSDKVDIWCVGILTYELLHKQAPYSQNQGQHFHKEAKQQNFRFRKNITEEMREFIKWILNYSPDKRPSAQDILNHPIFDRIKEDDQYEAQRQRNQQSEWVENPPKNQQFQSIKTKESLNVSLKNKLSQNSHYLNVMSKSEGQSQREYGLGGDLNDTSTNSLQFNKSAHLSPQKKSDSKKRSYDKKYQNLKFGEVTKKDKKMKIFDQMDRDKEIERINEYKKQMDQIRQYYMRQGPQIQELKNLQSLGGVNKNKIGMRVKSNEFHISGLKYQLIQFQLIKKYLVLIMDEKFIFGKLLGLGFQLLTGQPIVEPPNIFLHHLHHVQLNHDCQKIEKLSQPKKRQVQHMKRQYNRNISKAQIEEELLCPISQTKFVNPMMTQCGHTFELKNIVNYLSESNLCPLCRAKISYRDLVPNKVVKKLLESRKNKIHKQFTIIYV